MKIDIAVSLYQFLIPLMSQNLKMNTELASVREMLLTASMSQDLKINAELASAREILLTESIIE